DTRIRKNNAIEECTHPRILASVVLAAAHRCPRTTHYLSSSFRRRPESRHRRAGTTASKLGYRESTAHPRRPCECCILKTTAAAEPPSRAYEPENSPRTAPSSDRDRTRSPARYPRSEARATGTAPNG